jgi:hypothetical protein
MQRQQTGMAAEFWFYSQLHRLGYESYITLGNTKSIDIAVRLSDGNTLSFDVKGKLNFGGSFQYLDESIKENHFIVFVNLKTKIEKLGKRTFLPNPEPGCYIVKSQELHHIAYKWKSSSSDTVGYGFHDKMLWFLKHGDDTNITENNIKEFKSRHNPFANDLGQYKKIIWTLEDFENYYYRKK